MKDAFITTIANRIKAKQIGRRVLGEESGPLQNGVALLCLEISKALCGMIVSSLLFCRKLRNALEKLGFKVNPYDICVANKMINGKQFTLHSMQMI